ncbi:MAG: radical SAM protein [Candidatus Methanofastidiosia archaeon]|jgi:uncharacterized protein
MESHTGITDIPFKSSQYNTYFKLKDKQKYALMNTLTRAILSVDEELKNILETGDVNTLESHIKEALSSMGIIVPHNVDERKIYEFRHNVAKYATEDTAFVIFPTYDCNLRCPYCYEGLDKVSTYMDESTIENTIDFVKKTTIEHTSKRVVIGLYGGEPLLYPETCYTLVDSISAWAQTNNIVYYGTLTTNGTLLTEETAALLFPYIASVHITLDGSRHTHNQKRIYADGTGSYEDVMRAIDIVKDTVKHLTIRIHINLQDKTYPGIEVLDELEDKGLKGRKNLHIYFKQLEPPDACLSVVLDKKYIKKKEKELNEFPKAWKKAQDKGWGPHMSVEAGSEHGLLTFNIVPCDHLKRGRYTIDPFGDVYMCPMSAGRKHHSIGTIQKGGFFEYRPAYYTLITRDPVQLETCNQCVYLPVCSGGCPISIYEETKTYQGSYCGYTKALKEAAIKSHLRNTYPDKFSEVI